MGVMKRASSLCALTCDLSCCAPAFRRDLGRFGVIMTGSPRQADLLIVAGAVTKKMAPVLRRLYDQMPKPKYVLALGDCARADGPFRDSYFVVQGVDELLPVDVYVAGCPPGPEAVVDGILRLQEKIGRESVRERA